VRSLETAHLTRSLAFYWPNLPTKRSFCQNLRQPEHRYIAKLQRHFLASESQKLQERI
jgi:hypothetical protein